MGCTWTLSKGKRSQLVSVYDQEAKEEQISLKKKIVTAVFLVEETCVSWSKGETFKR